MEANPRVYIDASLLVCLSVYLRVCLERKRDGVCVGGGGRACVRACGCVRARARSCVRAWVRACVRACVSC